MQAMKVLLLARIISGRSSGTLIPLSVVALAELGNEVMDRLHFGSRRRPGTSMDVLNTLLWPAVICIAVRVSPLLLNGALERQSE